MRCCWLGWRTGGGENVAGPQHRTPEHRAARAALNKAQARGEVLWCVQGEPGTGSSGTCRMPSRAIYPEQPCVVAHNDAGSAIIGAAHVLCNATDGGKRKNKKLLTRRWAL